MTRALACQLRVTCALMACAPLTAGCDRSDTKPAREKDRVEAPTNRQRAEQKPPPVVAAPDARATMKLRPLIWIGDEAVAIAEASKRNKRLLIDFSADWCLPCKQLEAVTFTDSAVRKRLQNYVRLKLDVTEQSDSDKALQEKYKANSLPAVILLSPSGEELLRFEKFVEPKEMALALDALPPA